MKRADHRVLTRLISSHHEEARAKLIEHMERTGALLEGHFRLQSGLHSPYFIRFRSIGRDENALRWVRDQLVGHLEVASRAASVLCPESAGFYLGQAIADSRGLNLAVAAVDRERRPIREYRHGNLRAGATTLIAVDVATTGRSLVPLFDLAHAAGATVVGVIAFAVLDAHAFDRACLDRGVPGEWLASATFRPRSHAECDACRDGVPLEPAAEFN